MIISLIVAVSENGVIGKDNDLPWSLPSDMKFFKQTTLGHHVIMGRKNYESIPHKFSPLPNRTNIVITRQKEYNAPGCVVVNSLNESLRFAKENGEGEAFIIGGGQIYKMALENDLVDKIYLTKVRFECEGDTYFPKLNNNWKIIKKIQNKSDSKHRYDYDFIFLEKITRFTKN